MEVPLGMPKNPKLTFAQLALPKPKEEVGRPNIRTSPSALASAKATSPLPLSPLQNAKKPFPFPPPRQLHPQTAQELLVEGVPLLPMTLAVGNPALAPKLAESPETPLSHPEQLALPISDRPLDRPYLIKSGLALRAGATLFLALPTLPSLCMELTELPSF